MYRKTKSGGSGGSSSDDGACSDSDSNSPVKRSRGDPAASAEAAARSKKNIWADVLVEDDLSKGLSREVGVRDSAAACVQRDVESYDVPPEKRLHRLRGPPGLHNGSSSGRHRRRDGGPSSSNRRQQLDEEMDKYSASCSGSAEGEMEASSFSVRKEGTEECSVAVNDAMETTTTVLKGGESVVESDDPFADPFADALGEEPIEEYGVKTSVRAPVVVAVESRKRPYVNSATTQKSHERTRKPLPRGYKTNPGAGVVAATLEPLPDADATLDPAKLGAKMAAGLGEQKTELLVRVCELVGGALALSLYHATLTTEARGGLMVVDGSRRRTPGGVFLQLFREHTDIDADVKKKLFENERHDDKKYAKAKRRIKRAGQALTYEQKLKSTKSILEKTKAANKDIVLPDGKDLFLKTEAKLLRHTEDGELDSDVSSGGGGGCPERPSATPTDESPEHDCGDIDVDELIMAEDEPHTGVFLE